MTDQSSADSSGEPAPPVPITLEGAVGAAIMAALALITFANVLVRYFTSVSFAFTEEYSVVLMVVLTFVGSAGAFAADRHLRMTFLTDRLPSSLARTVELLVLAICLVGFASLAWLGALYVHDEYRFEILSPGLGVPSWAYTIWLPLLSVLICLRLAGRLARVARARSA